MLYMNVSWTPCEEIIQNNVQEGTVSENIFADFAS